MGRLSVNVDHVATMREARKGREPDPVTAVQIVELAGADGITVHLREDRRHIQDRDLFLMKDIVKTRINMEMAATQEMLEIALNVKPAMSTLVPEKRKELTTEGGLDVKSKSGLKEYIAMLHQGGIRVSLFIDPEPAQVRAARKAGADMVEIHTGIFSESSGEKEKVEFRKIYDAVRLASKLHLGVNAGHGLNYSNIKRIAQIEEIEEFSIGHSIVSRSIYVGLERAVKEMIELIRVYRGRY